MKRTIALALMLIATAAYAAGAPYCVAASWGLQCYYYNWGACQQAAQSLGAVCVVNPDIPR
jgi:hypothetical protein